ncbi:DUF4253 domain-containing protein [Streptomyces sp. NPDC005828]|uniref:DUF4253 domain-containing protein n=1 Tax=Streptomyces sp. NPDC005828 TaxID=3157071 RepID=UPI00340BBB31
MAMIPNQLPKLASDPTGRSFGLDLPPGALTGPADAPYLWLGHDAAGPAGWSALRPAARTAGLLPVLLGGEHGLDKWGPEVGLAEEGLDGWELEPERMSDPADHEADEVLAGFWECYAASEIPEEARDPRVTAAVEDRFGARVVALTFDQLVVSVAAPPRTPEEAEAVAAEHFAFCPDNITQGHHESLREYAREALLDVPVWSFWWD